MLFSHQLIRPHRVMMTPKGFTVSGGLIRSPKEVLWRDVGPFFVYRLPKGVKMIGYNFAPNARKDSLLLRTNRLIGAEAALPMDLPGSPDQIVDRINAYRVQALAHTVAFEAE